MKFTKNTSPEWKSVQRVLDSDDKDPTISMTVDQLEDFPNFSELIEVIPYSCT